MVQSLCNPMVKRVLKNDSVTTKESIRTHPKNINNTLINVIKGRTKINYKSKSK